MATRKQTLHTLSKLMEKIDIGMLTTVGPGGFLVSRPLSTQDAQFDGERVWFFTSARSPKVGEIGRNPKVNLAYASKDRNTYISAAGEARVSRDQARIDLYWNDAMKAFFPKGRTDPDLTLIEVALRSVEYWDGPSTWIGKAISFVAARVTGNDELMGENRIVDVASGRSRKAPGSGTGARRAGGARKVATSRSPKPAAKRTAPAKRAATSATAKRATPAKKRVQAPGKVSKTSTARPAAGKSTAGTTGGRARGQAEAQRRTRQR